MDTRILSIHNVYTAAKQVIANSSLSRKDDLIKFIGSHKRKRFTITDSENLTMDFYVVALYAAMKHKSLMINGARVVAKGVCVTKKFNNIDVILAMKSVVLVYRYDVKPNEQLVMFGEFNQPDKLNKVMRVNNVDNSIQTQLSCRLGNKV